VDIGKGMNAREVVTELTSPPGSHELVVVAVEAAGGVVDGSVPGVVVFPLSRVVVSSILPLKPSPP